MVYYLPLCYNFFCLVCVELGETVLVSAFKNCKFFPMKYPILALALFGFLSLTSLQAQQSERTLVKSINPSGSQAVAFDLPLVNLALKPWGETHLRVELEIEANAPLYVLDALAKAGRYELETRQDGDTLVVFAPNLYKPVTVGGKDLVERISMHVSAPGYFKVEGRNLVKDIHPDALARLEKEARDAGENATSARRRVFEIREQKMDIGIKFVSTYKEDAPAAPAPAAGMAAQRKSAGKPAKKAASRAAEPPKTGYLEVLLDKEPIKMQ